MRIGASITPLRLNFPETVFVPLVTELLSLAKEPLELSAGDDHEFDLSHKFASARETKMIDEATPSIHPQPSAVIATLARQAALKAVKAELRAPGRKPNSFTLPELRHQANDYFAEHRAELIAQTWEWVRSSPSLRELYDREQHDRQRAWRSCRVRARANPVADG